MLIRHRPINGNIMNRLRLLLGFLTAIALSVTWAGTAHADEPVTSSDHIFVGADIDSALQKNTPSRGLTTVVRTTIRLDYGVETLASGKKVTYREVCLAVARLVRDKTGNRISVTDQYGGEDEGEGGCVENVPSSGLSVANDLSSADVNVSGIAMTHTSGFCCDVSGEFYTTEHPAGTASVVASWTATEVPSVGSYCLTPANGYDPPPAWHTDIFRKAATVTAIVNGVSAGTPQIGADTTGFYRSISKVGCPSGY